ncbi:apolipoprotein d [Stylonychia lemnae]|uniref:Apolipoprotein d n=1 Tax=Stylonychia lemnae TaxID=5949 RepID=A0A078A026_STYLE|nr:apolipoprotein d [Stylonychia lemnae]|eukprot:CDW75495.1 apolipoprotein d [Stylonychia lemnae]
MQKTNIIVILTLALLDAAYCHFAWGKCPDVQLKATLDPVEYSGKWYEMYSGPLFKNVGQKCVTADYTLQTDSSIRVKNRAIKQDGTVGGIMGRATCRGAQCRVKFDSLFIPYGPYEVLEADYDSYAVVYTCSHYLFGVFRLQNIWILSRSTTLTGITSNDILTLINTKIPSYPTSILEVTEQGGSCTYA